ncbi:MAG: arginine N-succinyltransferase [Candidatus Azotimanducaceae bacterium]|jgi:arginine N-succinyltransferase
MLIIRPIGHNDLDGLFELAKKAGTGFTSLPVDKGVLAEKIEGAIRSFSGQEMSQNDYFLLVMEDLETGKIVGTSAAYAKTGSREAFYAYRLMSVTHYSHSLHKETRSSLLHLTNDYTDCSEVGTLFLDPAYRGNGHWLSRSRYMLMAQQLHRFAPDVIAELRGWMDEKNESPVWNAIGAHFFEMTFDEADRLSGTGSNQFITELMPKYPIYTNLLPAEARDALGKPNDAGVRAMELLLEEGFEYEGLVDIFDGGPLVRGRIKELASVRSAKKGSAEIDSGISLETSLETSLEKKNFMVANQSLKDFRLVFQPASCIDNKIKIAADALEALNVKPGDEIMAMG